jgi:uncharacterized membrane protein
MTFSFSIKSPVQDVNEYLSLLKGELTPIENFDDLLNPEKQSESFEHPQAPLALQPDKCEASERDIRLDYLNVLQAAVTRFHQQIDPSSFPQEKLFGHILVHSFIRGTFLEDLCFKEATDFLLQYFMNIDAVLSESPINPALRSLLISFLQQALRWDLRLETLWKENDLPVKRREALALLTRELLQHIDAYGQVIFPGRCQDDFSNEHVVLHTVKKLSNATYSCQTFNGDHKHLSLWTLEDRACCEAALIKLLSKQNPGNSSKESTSWQIAKMSSWNIWQTFFSSCMPKKMRFALKYRIRLFGLAQFYFHGCHTKSESNKVLFTEGCKAFSRCLAKYHHRKYISQEELSLGLGIVQALIPCADKKKSPLTVFQQLNTLFHENHYSSADPLISPKTNLDGLLFTSDLWRSSKKLPNDYGAEISECSQMKWLRIPEALNFFRRHPQILHRDDGRKMLSRLLFGEEERVLDIRIDAFDQNPFILEMTMDGSLQSLKTLWKILGPLVEYGWTNRDCSILEFISQIQSTVKKCLEVGNRLKGPDIHRFPDLISKDKLYAFIELASSEELLQISAWYFESAQRWKAFDAVWLKMFVKISYMLAQIRKNFPNRTIITLSLFEAAKQLPAIIPTNPLHPLMKEIFLLAKISEPIVVCEYVAEAGTLRSGRYTFELFTGCLKKGTVPIPSLHWLTEADFPWMRTILLPNEGLSKFILNEKEGIFSLANNEVAMKISADSLLVSCSRNRIHAVLEKICFSGFDDKIDVDVDFLYLNNPLESSLIYSQSKKNIDFAFRIEPQDYTVHPRYQRWLSVDPEQLILLDTQAKRAFYQIAKPRGQQEELLVYDLTNNLIRHEAFLFAGRDWYRCMPEHYLHIWVWTKPSTDVLQMVELPRYNLSFMVGERLASVEHKGYYLDTVCNPVPNVEHVISLKNRRGDRIMIIPDAPFFPAVSRVQEPFDPRLCLRPDPNPLQPQRSFIYYKKAADQSIQPPENESFGYIGSQPKAMLFLAGLHFQAKNYPESLYYLERSLSVLNENIEVLGLLLEIIHREKTCHHLNHQAMLLHFIKKALEISSTHYILARHENRAHEFTYIAGLYSILQELLHVYIHKRGSINPILVLSNEELTWLYRPEYKQEIPDCLHDFLLEGPWSKKRKLPEENLVSNTVSKVLGRTEKIENFKLLDAVFDVSFDQYYKNSRAIALSFENDARLDTHILNKSLIHQMYQRLKRSVSSYKGVLYRFKNTMTSESFLLVVQNELKNEKKNHSHDRMVLLECLHAFSNPEGNAVQALEITCKEIGGVERAQDVEKALDWMIMKEGSVFTFAEAHLLVYLRNYMLSSIRIHHLCELEKKSLDFSYSQDDLGALSARAHYEIGPFILPENRIILYFEYKTGITLTEKQHAVIRDSFQDGKRVFQLACGSGKTKILTSLLALLETQRKKLAVIVVPVESLSIQVQVLQETLSRLSHRSIYIFRFDTSMCLEADFLDAMLRELQKAFEDGILVVTEPNSLHALLLGYFQQLERISIGHRTIHERHLVTVLEKTLSLFMQNSSAIMDDAYSLLGFTRHFAVALENKITLSRTRWENLACLFSIMLAINQEKNASCFFPIGTHYQQNWPEKNYHSIMLPRLAVEIAHRLVPAVSQSACCAYLCFDPHSTDFVTRNHLTEWLACLSPSVRSKLQYIRAQLQIYLPHTLKARVDIHYGISPTRGTAISFLDQQNPAEQASFENVDILVNYTFQYYLNKGLDVQQVTKLLRSWQQQHQTESMAGCINTEPSKTIRKLIPDISLDRLDLNDKAIIEFLHQKLQLEPALIFDYLHRFIFSKFNCPKEKISSRSVDLSSVLFNKVTALSSALSNYLIYPAGMECKFDSEVQGEALQVLMDPSSTLLVKHELPLKSPLPYSLVIDPSAFFEGLNNHQVAERLLINATESISHALFFDDNNRTVLMDRSGNVVSASDEICPPEKRITYCDQKHCTGMDSVQPLQGTALLLIHQRLSLTQLIQGAKRMRRWGKGQLVVLWCSPQVYNEIFARFQRFNMTALIGWCVQNEESNHSQGILPSYLDQLHSLYHSSALRLIMSFSCSDPNKLAQYNKYRGLFVEKVNLDVYLEHARLQHPNTPIQIFEAKCKEYHTKYPEVLSVVDKNDLNKICSWARTLLGVLDGMSEPPREQLDATIMLQNDYVQENRKFDAVIYNRPILWKPNSLFYEEKFLNDFMGREQSTPSNTGSLAQLKIPFEPLARIFPDAHFTPALFATENFLCKQAIAGRVFPVESTKKDRLLLEKYLPPVKYLLRLTLKSPLSVSRYIILGDKETEQLRKWILKLPNEKSQLNLHIALYDVEGTCWARSPGDSEHAEIEQILAQVGFLNGQTFYEGMRKKELEMWVNKEKMLDQYHFFREMQRLRSYRWNWRETWKGSVLQQIFKTVASRSELPAKPWFYAEKTSK